MNNRIDIEKFFSDIESNMLLKFRGWEKTLPHEGEKGGVRERRVVDFLNSFLPKRYGIGTGHVISARKPFHSLQADIVIYDALDGVVLPVDQYYCLFPCECVFAVIEVKSCLTASKGKEGPTGTVYECVEQATSLKDFDRGDLGPIHSVAFAYDTSWVEDNAIEKTREWFELFCERYTKKLPEVILVLNPKPGFVWKADYPEGNNASKLTHLYRRSPLLYFATNLVAQLAKMKTRTPNLWEEYVEWATKDVIADIPEHGEIRKVAAERVL